MSAGNVGAALLGLSPGEKETLQGLLGQLTLQGLLPGGPQPGVGLLRRLFASLRPRQLGRAAIFTAAIWFVAQWCLRSRSTDPSKRFRRHRRRCRISRALRQRLRNQGVHGAHPPPPPPLPTSPSHQHPPQPPSPPAKRPSARQICVCRFALCPYTYDYYDPSLRT